jgi:protocatechuate 4,5-dioxygenase alpha chain
MDKKSMQDLGGIFTGMTTEEFVAALNAGGRHFG